LQLTLSTTASGRSTRTDIRNVAIIAHVDHGKTTLVDGMLKQSRVFRENQAVGELILDSNALEREKGITILAKNTSVRFQSTRINIIDTPGHADFSGEVERVLNMADGCLLLVDAVEGPMPQTKFVLRKALQLGLKPVVVVNKIDRANARIDEVLNLVQDLFLELATDAEQLDFEVVYTSARAGTATLDPNVPGTDLVPLFQTIVSSIPAPEVDLTGSFQMLVTNIRSNEYLGRAAVGRIERGVIRKGDQLVRIDDQGTVWRQRASDVFLFEGLDVNAIEEAGAGDIVMITGIDDVNIGDTIATVEDPEALPRLEIEQPTVRMTIGVNTSPLAGREGQFVTSRQIRARLYRELETNIALRVEEGSNEANFLVSGRGELHLAILVETLRREGYEFQVSRPQIIPREIDGRLCEPVEHLVIDTTEANVGPISQELSNRAAQLMNHHNDGRGNVRLEYRIPTRGLIGLRSVFLTLTRGDGIMASLLEGYEPITASIVQSRNGALVTTNTGVATTYGLNNAQERGDTFVEPGTQVYEGMIVGLARYPQDVPINVTKEKKQTNIRSSTSDIAVRLTPPVLLSLEESLAWIEDDELVEVTPKSVRLRKKLLNAEDRIKERKNAQPRS
jgi:GTP-binding protein